MHLHYHTHFHLWCKTKICMYSKITFNVDFPTGCRANPRYHYYTAIHVYAPYMLEGDTTLFLLTLVLLASCNGLQMHVLVTGRLLAHIYHTTTSTVKIVQGNIHTCTYYTCKQQFPNIIVYVYVNVQLEHVNPHQLY